MEIKLTLKEFDDLKSEKRLPNSDYALVKNRNGIGLYKYNNTFTAYRAGFKIEDICVNFGRTDENGYFIKFYYNGYSVLS